MLPLLSLCLATLMALFKDSDFSWKVSPEELSILLRETGSALLDEKLSSADCLSEECGSQMVRAINKVNEKKSRESGQSLTHCFRPQLAVQSATGASRHISFQALLHLQHELTSGDDALELNGRLSRVITKLFARVIRAEEAAGEPFSLSSFDMEALLCSMEDTLNKCQPSDPSFSMVQTLTAAILQEHGDPSVVRNLMVDLDIDRDSSALGKMIAEWEGSGEASGGLLIDSSANATSQVRPQPKTPSKDVAALVSRLGNAPEGEERAAALDAIKRFKQANGDADLRAHLQQLSGPFREFIEEQIGKTSPSKLPAESGSVSERIRSLRSRLQAKGTLNGNNEEAEGVTTETASPSTSTKIPSPSRASSIPKASPSKLPQPGSRTTPTLRERLQQTSSTPTGNISTGTNRAAALRARLEAVKQQTNQK